MITLENKYLKALIDPDYGACIMGLFAKKEGGLLPLMPDARHNNIDLDAACFLMMPYSNRIENGKFSFDGKNYQLKNGKEHSIHGDVRHRKWVVDSVNDISIKCVFNSLLYEDINWPWPFKATVEYLLNDNIFSSRLSLTNLDELLMPAGFGWHPYFSRDLTQKDEKVFLCMNVKSVYPDANGNRIPSGPSQPLDSEQDFYRKKELKKDYFLDACFYDYDGKGYIHWPDSKVKLNFDCSSNCKHLIMFNPEKPYFAVEPVTNANNGVNLLAKRDSTSGVVTLSSNEILEAYFNLMIEIE